MKKFFLSLAVFVMAICANAQTNQYFWYQGNLMMGNPIAQIDSVTFGEGEPVDTLHIMLPRTIIKTIHDTVSVTIHDTVCPNNLSEDVLPGEFYVNPTKKIRFSHGNLQYKASTNTWRFAENQWDHVGDASTGTVYCNNVKCNNALISSTYDGWIDLFGWGTGGNPTLTSTNNSDYTVFTDWGIAYSTANSSQKSSEWYTLSSEEWKYIFKGRLNAESLFGFGSVNGVNGLIILPDNWVKPIDVVFNPSTQRGLSWGGSYYYNSNEDNFSHNTYTAVAWSKMEAAGAVFLPIAGGRNGVSIDGVGEYSDYWSSTQDNTSGGGYRLGLNSYILNPQNGYQAGYHNGSFYGRSVRLVHDVE